MKPLRAITQLSAIGGGALTIYGLWADEFNLLSAAVLLVFFFWAHFYATFEIDL